MKIKSKDLRKQKNEETKRQFISSCKLFGLPAPEVEYRFLAEGSSFSKPRKYRLDYYWPSFRLALEQEGGAYIMGRHNRPVGYLKDMEKYNLLTLSGIWLLRSTPKQISNGEAIRQVLLFVQAFPYL